jgi:hypothetical protein
MGLEPFMNRMASAMTVLSMPGLGADTYRCWEALYIG